MSTGEVGALFFHRSIFNSGAELFESGDVEVDRSFTDDTASGDRYDDIFVGTAKERSDHQDRDPIRTREPLGDI